MTRSVNFVHLVAVVACTIIPRPESAKAVEKSDISPISVVARALTRKGKQQACVFVIANRETVPLTNVRITVYREGQEGLALKSLKLEPGEASIQEQIDPYRTECTGQDVFYLVSWEQQGVKKGALLTSDSVTSSPAPNVIGSALVGGLLALAGVWLTHVTTQLRERRKDRSSWGRERFQTMEHALGAFLKGWSRSTMADVLRAHFEEMQSQLVLTQEIIDLYHSTHSVFNSATATPSDKVQAATQLEKRLLEELRALDPSG